MKRVALLLALLLPLVSGCDMKGIDQDILLDARQDKPVGEKVILSAYVADGATDTKTSYNWSTNKILWNPGDKISLFYGSGTNGGERFTSTLTESSNKSDFSGTISIVSGVMEDSDEKQFWGIYPYSQQNESAGSYVTVTVQHEQTAVAETFAQGHFVSIGRSPGLSMGFYNLCGAFYVKFTRDDIVSVKFRGKGGQPVAGRVKVGMNSSGKPEVQEFVEQQTEVTLSLPGGYAFTPGVGYYIVSLPAVFSDGFEFEMTTAAGYKGTKSFNINYTLARNDFQGFSKTIDNGVEFTKEGTIDFADANVKAICVAPATGWDTNGDGELSYTEAAAVTSIPYGVFSENTTITSFDEFQYFTSVTSLGYHGDYDEGMDYYGAFSYCSALTSIILPSSLHDISFGAFRGCSSLESITIPSTVTRIGQVAFDGCTNLEVIMESATPCTLYPDSYETYPGETCAFGLYNNEVKAILVPTDESVTAYKTAQYWSDYAFLIHKVGWVDPSSLITFKDAVVELYCVDRWGTDGDERLSMAEAAAVTDIGTTFQGVDITSFDELKYFTGITTIPESAFAGCTLLESISFPPQITSVGTNAFKNNNKLKKVTVPSIDVWLIVCPVGPLFNNTRKGDLYINDNLVTEIVVPDGTTSVPAYMCYGVNNLESVSLPSSVTNIGKSAFAGCQWLTSIDSEGLLQIGESAFSGCSNLSSINLESVTTIGEYTFSGCSSLTSISLREGVSLGNHAFNNCTGLTSLVIPNGTGLGNKAGIFRGCSGLMSVVLPTPTNSNTVSQNSIGMMNGSYDGIFSGCTSLQEIIIPEGIKYIYDNSFNGCSSLKRISLPSTLLRITNYAFYGCTGITSDIVIPGGVSTIGKYAFANCNVEGIIILEEGVTTIERNAFTGTSAALLSLPSTIQQLYTYVAGSVGVKAMDYGAFVDTMIDTYEVYSSTLGETFIRGFTTTTYASMNNLNGTQSEVLTKVAKNIIVKKSDLTYTLPDRALYGLTSIESVTLPNGLTSIGSYAFSTSGVYLSGFTHLTNITLPATLKTIGQGAFQKCSGLTSITIPSGVTSIGDSAFSGCSGLTSIQVNPTTPPTGGSSMFASTNDAPIYVPSGSVDTYKAATIWNDYASRIQAIP